MTTTSEIDSSEHSPVYLKAQLFHLNLTIEGLEKKRERLQKELARVDEGQKGDGSTKRSLMLFKDYNDSKNSR